MPSQDFIKGKADIFSFVMEILDGIRKNGQRVTCGDIVTRIEHLVNTPLRDPHKASIDYHAGVMDALQHFRGYFVPREDMIDSDSVKYIKGAVEERFEALWRQLNVADSNMTLAELWAANGMSEK